MNFLLFFIFICVPPFQEASGQVYQAPVFDQFSQYFPKIFKRDNRSPKTHASTAECLSGVSQSHFAPPEYQSIPVQTYHGYSNIKKTAIPMKGENAQGVNSAEIARMRQEYLGYKQELEKLDKQIAYLDSNISSKRGQVSGFRNGIDQRSSTARLNEENKRKDLESARKKVEDERKKIEEKNKEIEKKNKEEKAKKEKDPKYTPKLESVQELPPLPYTGPIIGSSSENFLNRLDRSEMNVHQSHIESLSSKKAEKIRERNAIQMKITRMESIYGDMEEYREVFAPPPEE